MTELALWGRRQQGQASRQTGYLEGVLGTVSSVAVGAAGAKELSDQVALQLQELLGVDDARFSPGMTPQVGARINHDGSVSRAGHTVDVGARGCPPTPRSSCSCRAAAW